MNSILEELLEEMGIKIKKNSNNDPNVVFTQEDSNKKNKSNKNKKKVPKAVYLTAIVLILGSLFISDIFYTVNEQQKAVVTRSGKYYKTQEAGIHFKLPIFDDVTLVDSRTKFLEIGYRSDGSTSESIENESIMITSDFNFVVIDFFVEYQVSDPKLFTFATANPEEILKNIVQSEIRGTVAKYTVDEVLTTSKTEIQTQILEKTNLKSEEYDLGLYIQGISIQDAEPPTVEVADAFKAVESAKQNKETEINKAKQYKEQEIPKARSIADKTIKKAESEKESRIAEATGQVARFNAMFEEYIKNPEITKTRLYYETMEDILPDLEVYIDSGDGILKMLPLGE